ncbi:MAG: hypothetical protein GWO07_04045 [Candidatus Dadabacteria bacterium]|nr:hypothetical protein [Candidatus Dadabacteria bacterium]NIS07935.1 hypothetical protein [Candidatus Dadabacteria bacterium]NIY21519.1 hypothetical protein [Candidatus Dadabacteria bacterium]
MGFIIHARSNLGTYIAVTESLISIFAIVYSLYVVDRQLYLTVENPELGGSFYGLIESRNTYYINFLLSIPAWRNHYRTIRSKVGKKK